MQKFLQYLIVLTITQFALSACSSSDGDNKKSPSEISGTRISIISGDNAIEADDSLGSTSIIIPETIKPAAWGQAGGNASNHLDNIYINQSLDEVESAKIGDGNDWDSPIISTPVVSINTVFAIDSKGIISAHQKSDIGKILWKSEALVDENISLSGGGLAYYNDRLVAVSSNGHVGVFAAKDGKLIWQKQLKTPIRVAPKVADNIIYISSMDSQIFAMDIYAGNIYWSHQGIVENASLMSEALPSIADNIIIKTYSSGDIFALNSGSGAVLWADSLLLSRRTSALGEFSGIGGNPVINGGLVFNISNNGLLAANLLSDGRRVWERSISSNNTVWVASNFLYLLSSDNLLTSIYSADGRVKWVSDIKSELDDDWDKNIFLNGPYMVNGKLLLTSNIGKWFLFNAEDGKLNNIVDVDINSYISKPAFSDGIIYVVGENAKLYAVGQK